MEANNTTSQENTVITDLEKMEFRIAKITLYVLILILSCVGNSLVAVVVVGARDMRTPSNFLILSLALCDFITPALSIPFDLALEESEYIWPFGKTLCKVLWPLQTAFSTSSSLNLALISLERYKTLSNPFGRRMSNRHVLVFVLTIHATSISLCIPYFVVLNYNDFESSCDEIWPNVGYRKAYTILLFLFGYFLPLMTMSMAYMLIYRSLRSNLIRLTSSSNCDQQRPRNVSKAPERSNVSKDSMEHRRREQNIHLAKMFIIVVVVFAISMFPNQILWLWVDFGDGGENKSFNYISVGCRLCTYANSVLNPFIYALKSKEFRSGFARIGRASTLPLRKISSETRKFARKMSRSVSDNQRPVSVPAQCFAGSTSPVKIRSVHRLDGKERKTHQVEVGKCQAVEADGMKITKDISFEEIFRSPNLHIILEELRETDC